MSPGRWALAVLTAVVLLDSGPALASGASACLLTGTVVSLQSTEDEHRFEMLVLESQPVSCMGASGEAQFCALYVGRTEELGLLIADQPDLQVGSKVSVVESRIDATAGRSAGKQFVVWRSPAECGLSKPDQD